MRVTVRLFATLRELVGARFIDIELPARATVADALQALRAHGGMDDALARIPVVMAVNHEYADAGVELHPNDEIALIPPVSGGGGEIDARVSRNPLSLRDVSRLVERPGAGAIVTFQGTTRDVERLDYEAYVEMAEKRIHQILGECLKRHGLQAIAAQHRVGSVPLGEASVVVAASSAHRDEAFAGVREAIDRIKAEAPIWKREVQGESSQWVQGVLP